MDVLLLYRRVPDEAVDAYLSRLGLPGDAWVCVDPAQAPCSTAAGQAVQPPYVLARLRALVRVSTPTPLCCRCGVQ